MKNDNGITQTNSNEITQTNSDGTGWLVSGWILFGIGVVTLGFVFLIYPLCAGIHLANKYPARSGAGTALWITSLVALVIVLLIDFMIILGGLALL